MKKFKKGQAISVNLPKFDCLGMKNHYYGKSGIIHEVKNDYEYSVRLEGIDQIKHFNYREMKTINLENCSCGRPKKTRDDFCQKCQDEIDMAEENSNAGCAPDEK